MRRARRTVGMALVLRADSPIWGAFPSLPEGDETRFDRHRALWPLNEHDKFGNSVSPFFGSCSCEAPAGGSPPPSMNGSASSDDRSERIAIRQDLPRREFSGRLLSHSPAASGAHSC